MMPRSRRITTSVGDTTAHKLKFWEAKVGEYYISHNPTDEQKVAVMELSWLADQFPQDMLFC